VSRRSIDRGLYCSRLEWWLRWSGAAALGQRSTTGAVAAAIERGNASGSGQNDADLQALERLGYLGKRQNLVALERACSARWQRLSAHAQRELLAHYMLTPRVDSKIRARFGELAGIAVLLWLDAASAERARVQANIRDNAFEPLNDARSKALELDSELRGAREAARGWEGAERLRKLARLHYLRALTSRAWSELGLLKRAEHTLLDNAGTFEADLRTLTLACSRSSPPPLQERADATCRAAHADWYATLAAEARSWADGEGEEAVGPSPAS
jgi:hypothetical protein